MWRFKNYGLYIDECVPDRKAGQASGFQERTHVYRGIARAMSTRQDLAVWGQHTNPQKASNRPKNSQKKSKHTHTWPHDMRARERGCWPHTVDVPVTIYRRRPNTRLKTALGSGRILRQPTPFIQFYRLGGLGWGGLSYSEQRVRRLGCGVVDRPAVIEVPALVMGVWGRMTGGGFRCVPVIVIVMGRLL